MKHFALIISTSQEWLQECGEELSKLGLQVKATSELDKGLQVLRAEKIDLVLVDYRISSEAGLSISVAARNFNPLCEIIVTHATKEFSAAYEALKQHAFDYFTDQHSLSHVIDSVKQVIAKLERAGKPVHNQTLNEKLISDIGMLVEISALLNQVTEEDLATDIILDTLYEAFGIDQTAIILKNDENRFIVKKTRGLGLQFEQKFAFTEQDSINGKEINLESVNTLVPAEHVLKINQEDVKLSSQVNVCIMHPMRYQDKCNGFLLAMIEEGQFYGQEIIMKILKFLSTQAAAVFHNLFELSKPKLKFGKRAYDNLILEMMQDNIETARALGGTVSFCFLRVVQAESITDAKVLNETISAYRQTIAQNLDEEMELVWQTLDTALVIMPGADIFTSESVLMELRQKVEALQVFDGVSAGLTVKYAYVNYPQIGSDLEQIIATLWKRLFAEMEKPGQEGNLQNQRAGAKC